MAQPVWVLSVDLQTKTATFQTGMADAARGAKEAFKGIKEDADSMAQGVGEAGGKTTYSMMEARHGVMMLGEEFGVHLPRGLTTFIASLGPVGAAMETAFPFLAIISDATHLIEEIMKIGEAAEKAAEAGHKLDDDMGKGINKAKEEMIDAEIEIRKLAGAPAWDLLADRLKLKDADSGRENVDRLTHSFAELLKVAGPTSNWNPFNWGDHSDETANKAKMLEEQMRGKSQSEQGAVLSGALQIQSKILEQMKGQTDVSAAQLKNQQTYVDFLKQESELIQDQADKEVLADQAKQGQDRAAKIKQAEEEQQKLYEAQQRGLDKRFKIEAEYTKHVAEEHKKQAQEHIKEEELEAEATASVTKSMIDAEKERAHITEELGKEEAEHVKKMSALTLSEEQKTTNEMVKLHHNRTEAIIAEQTAAENAEYQAQMKAYQTELAALDKYGKDYEVHLKQLQDREEELTKQHENKLTQIKVQAEEERDARILAADHKAQDEMVNSMMKVLQGHETAGKALIGIGQQVASGLLENAIKSVMANDFTKESDAAAAARKAYLAGMHFPFPVNIVMGPTLGALAFASVMAFEEGGIVPGVEQGDVVPARLTPGEGVIPKDVMENLKTARSGSGDNARPAVIHQHTHQWNLNAFDADGMDRVLEKHSDVIEKHVEHQFRKKGM